MDKVARLPAQQRSELFSETATQKGTTPAVVEKDFWVTWVLNRLFQEPDLARLLMFKGGTSLSKVYNLIERFSEDIDILSEPPENCQVYTGKNHDKQKHRDRLYSDWGCICI